MANNIHVHINQNHCLQCFDSVVEKHEGLKMLCHLSLKNVSRTSGQPMFALKTSVKTEGGSVAEWLACWTQVQKGPGSNYNYDAVG